MVDSITSMTGKGLRDWFLQRVSAVVIGAYAVFLMGYFLMHPHVDFSQWQALFSCVWMQIAGTLVIISIVTHAWIGLWTVSTDYIKPACVRGVFITTVLLALWILLIWGIKIVWGI